MCSSGKYPYVPHRRSMELPRGGGGDGEGVAKAKVCKEGWEGAKPKKPSVGGMDTFWNHTIQESWGITTEKRWEFVGREGGEKFSFLCTVFPEICIPISSLDHLGEFQEREGSQEVI